MKRDGHEDRRDDSHSHVGSRVTQLLVQAGVRPTLLLRSASRPDVNLRGFVDPIEGDQSDVDYVVAATQGADGLQPKPSAS